MEKYAGTCTHHHGVGQDHAPGLLVENGDMWIEFLRYAKKFYDPAGISEPVQAAGWPRVPARTLRSGRSAALIDAPPLLPMVHTIHGQEKLGEQRPRQGQLEKLIGTTTQQ
ncbi:MAG: FAD-linked oxidase C-terminal domain-containing protein [Lawsonella clevelandensis]